MTIREILRALEPTKPISVAALYSHLRKLKIRPISRVRQIPQQYPDDTPDRLLIRLGFQQPKKTNGRMRRARARRPQLRRAA